MFGEVPRWGGGGAFPKQGVCKTPYAITLSYTPCFGNVPP